MINGTSQDESLISRVLYESCWRLKIFCKNDMSFIGGHSWIKKWMVKIGIWEKHGCMTNHWQNILNDQN